MNNCCAETYSGSYSRGEWGRKILLKRHHGVTLLFTLLSRKNLPARTSPLHRGTEIPAFPARFRCLWPPGLSSLCIIARQVSRPFSLAFSSAPSLLIKLSRVSLPRQCSFLSSKHFSYTRTRMLSSSHPIHLRTCILFFLFFWCLLHRKRHFLIRFSS